MIVTLEGEVVRSASVVTCVSRGIANRMKIVHDMSEAPTVIRNTPFYQPTAFRPTGDRVEVLYHGLVRPRPRPGRVHSKRSFRGVRNFRFTIRGPAGEAYAEDLQKLIADAGVEGRVRLVPPVPMVDLVREAAAFDIGIFVVPLSKLQNTYVLPNKLFEYIMAGLALCVSSTPEIGGGGGTARGRCPRSRRWTRKR